VKQIEGGRRQHEG